MPFSYLVLSIVLRCYYITDILIMGNCKLEIFISCLAPLLLSLRSFVLLSVVVKSTAWIKKTSLIRFDLASYILSKMLFMSSRLPEIWEVISNLSSYFFFLICTKKCVLMIWLVIIKRNKSNMKQRTYLMIHYVWIRMGALLIKFTPRILQFIS